jgi:transposase-like protein
MATKNQAARRTFTEEEKTEMANSVGEGETIPQAAERLGINPSVFRRWVKDFGDASAIGRGQGQTKAAQSKPQNGAPRPSPTTMARKAGGSGRDSAAAAIRSVIDRNESETAALKSALEILEGGARAEG